jgi:hypothetical protein
MKNQNQPRNDEELLRMLGYGAVGAYFIFVSASVLQLNEALSTGTNIESFVALWLLAYCLPGVPCLIVIIPSGFLPSPLAKASLGIGIFGMCIAIGLGFTVSVGWFVLAFLSFFVHLFAYKIRKKQSVLV